MIKPETSDFFGNELDKAKLEIVSYWKDKYEKTRKALEIAVDALKISNEIVYSTYGSPLKTLKDALEQITALEQKDK